MRFGNVNAHWRVVVVLPCLAALLLIPAPAVRAQQTDNLQQQIEQLKREYEQQTADLQKRIAALEREAAEQKARQLPQRDTRGPRSGQPKNCLSLLRATGIRMRKGFRNKPPPIQLIFS